MEHKATTWNKAWSLGAFIGPCARLSVTSSNLSVKAGSAGGGQLGLKPSQWQKQPRYAKETPEDAEQRYYPARR